jgi:REP element-mobilizing transposase RayT
VVLATRLPRETTDHIVTDFVDPRQTPFFELASRGELPHLYKEGGTYFVTFRLGEAVIPTSKRMPPADLKSLDPLAVVEASEPPILQGSCVLSDPNIAQIVQGALLYFNCERYRLLAWCVMPNHVHVVFQPLGSYTASSILHSWKSFTSHQINQRLGRRGPLWERESFDHLVRSIDRLERFVRYVERNPVAARLCGAPKDWKWSSAGVREFERIWSIEENKGNAGGRPAPHALGKGGGRPAPQ